METAINEAISTTVATLVDKAVTGAMENAFTEAVNKAVEEKVHAIEDRFAAAVDKAVEEKVKVIEEAIEKKISRAARISELCAYIDATKLAISERLEMARKSASTRASCSWHLQRDAEDCRKLRLWEAALAKVEKEDQEQV